MTDAYPLSKIEHDLRCLSEIEHDLRRAAAGLAEIERQCITAAPRDAGAALLLCETLAGLLVPQVQASADRVAKLQSQALL